jgi:hypothetical protein
MSPMTVPQINVKNGTSTIVMTNKIQSSIINEVKLNIPNFSSLANDIGFLTYVCTCVEHMAPKSNSQSKHPVDKKAICMQIMIQLFSLTPEQQTNTSNLIDYLVSSNAIKPPKSKVFGIMSKSVSFLKNYL